MVIYRHKDKYAISEMCRFFKVSRSGYYDFVKRMDIPAWDLPLAEKIRECQDKRGRTYGYRWLERNGIYRNPKTVLRVMQKYGLLSVIRRKEYRNYLFDNSIVAYKTGTEQNINLVLSTIREAKKKEKVTAEL